MGCLSAHHQHPCHPAWWYLVGALLVHSDPNNITQCTVIPTSHERVAAAAAAASTVLWYYYSLLSTLPTPPTAAKKTFPLFFQKGVWKFCTNCKPKKQRQSESSSIKECQNLEKGNPPKKEEAIGYGFVGKPLLFASYSTFNVIKRV